MANEIEVPDTDFSVTFVHKKTLRYIALVGSRLELKQDTPIYAAPNKSGPVKLVRHPGDVVEIFAYIHGWYRVYKSETIDYWMEA